MCVFLWVLLCFWFVFVFCGLTRRLVCVFVFLCLSVLVFVNFCIGVYVFVFAKFVFQKNLATKCFSGKRTSVSSFYGPVKGFSRKWTLTLTEKPLLQQRERTLNVPQWKWWIIAKHQINDAQRKPLWYTRSAAHTFVKYVSNTYFRFAKNRKYSISSRVI